MLEIWLMNKVVIDTNVLIYGLDARSGFHSSAVKILTNNSIVLYTPTKVISEYFAVSSKIGIPEDQVWSFYEEIKKFTNILFPDKSSMAQFEMFMKKYKPRANRVFDMEIVSLALGNQINQLATANVKDFQDISEIELIQLERKKYS